MSLADDLFEAMQQITRTQREREPTNLGYIRTEAVKAAMSALMAHLDAFAPTDVGPRNRMIMDRLMEHIAPLIPPEGVYVPIAEDSDEEAQAQEEELEQRVHARNLAERELEAQGLPWLNVLPQAASPTDSQAPTEELRRITFDSAPSGNPVQTTPAFEEPARQVYIPGVSVNPDKPTKKKTASAKPTGKQKGASTLKGHGKPLQTVQKAIKTTAKSANKKRGAAKSTAKTKGVAVRSPQARR